MPIRPDILCPVCKTLMPPLEAGRKTLACPNCGRVLTAYETGMADVRADIRQMRMIDAIGRYRRLTGADLKTAKDAVTEMWHSGDC